MKHPTVKNSRVAFLFVSLLVGIHLKYPGVATAQTSADLTIAMYNTPLDVYTNDYMPYSMFVTNLGPGTVASVVVTNILPSGFSLIGATPAYTLTGNTLTFNLGSLTNLAVQKLTVSAKPSSAGSYTVSSSVSSTSNTDPNTANNVSGFSVNVGNYLPSTLTMSLVSTNFTNFQLGLQDQWAQISNVGSSPIASARIVVSGLTTKSLYFAAGTNNGNPYVIYGSTLAPGQSAELLLEFNPHGSFTFSSSQLQAFSTPLANLTPPGNLGAPMSPSYAVRTSTNTVLIEWPSVVGQSYTVVYSDNPEFANPLFAPPTIVAGANIVQWVDSGPPLTVSAPTNALPRYYRIYLTP
jgi:uncharacterized repeat protein (TIGR01451 family)